MSTAWTLEKDLCRCCHAEGAFQNLGIPCGEEVYIDMLQSCLNVCLNPLSGELQKPTFTICDNCISRLRDAFNFKKQVLVCEERLQDVVRRDCIKILRNDSATEIKVEPEVCFSELKEEVNESDEDSPKTDETDDDDSDYDFDADTNPKAKPKPKRPSKLTKNGRKRGRPPTVKKESEPPQSTTEKQKKGETASSRPTRFRMSATDYKLDGENCICLHCDKSYRSRNSLIEHIAVTHYGMKRYSCSVCLEKFDTSRAVLRHKGQAHGNAPPPLRGQFRLTPVDYKLEGKVYTCSRCDKTYTCRDGMRAHVAVKHFNIKRFQCLICLERFSTRHAVTLHKEQAHDICPTYPCKACDRSYKTKMQLTKHMDIYHMLGSLLKCESCEYTTYSSINLKRHGVKHGAAAKYKCSYCKKAFPRQTTMRLHEKIHTGEKNKVCKECGQAFIQKASLNYHMTKYHPEVPF